MPFIEPDKPLIVLLGPTAVGKTEVSLTLAAEFDGEIISADSRLFYRGMDIGTAKPSPEARARIPHHLVDVADPDDTWSLARYQRAAMQIIPAIQARGGLPILVGGTGQYIRAVCEGWQVPAVKPDPALRAALERWAGKIGSAGLFGRLEQLDPEAAAGIDPRNERRTIRALEVILTTGQRFSAQRRRTPPDLCILQLGLIRPRPELYERIDNRLDAMMGAGFLDEVEGLLANGYPASLPSMSAIGYRELATHLAGEYDLPEALRLIRRRTRQFVRRQANWFKAEDPRIEWYPMSAEVAGALAARVRLFLEEMSKGACPTGPPN